MIRVIVVDDSLSQRELIIHLLQKDPAIQVIDSACDGEEAVKKVILKQPDIITMDIHMPKLSGIEATRKIMSTKPVPIIIITSSCLPDKTMYAIEAIQAGALTIIDKSDLSLENPAKIIDVVKAMSEVKVVKRYQHLSKNHKPSLSKKNNTLF